jgi:hypothetical protein
MLFFSFSLYGSADIYTKGMIENAKILSGRFPAARIQIYAAQDVPADIIRILSDIPRVNLVRVPNKGVQNTFDRFEAIDEPDCSIMFVLILAKSEKEHNAIATSVKIEKTRLSKATVVWSSDPEFLES